MERDGRVLSFLAAGIGVLAGSGIVWIASSENPATGCPSSSSPPPLGPWPISVSAWTEESSGSDHRYNASLLASGSQYRWDGLLFEVGTSSHLPLAPSPNWTLRVGTDSAGILGVYSLANRSWTSGGHGPVVSSELTLASATTELGGDWYTLTVPGIGPCVPSATIEGEIA